MCRCARGTHVGDEAIHSAGGIGDFPYHQIPFLEQAGLIQSTLHSCFRIVAGDRGSGAFGSNIGDQADFLVARIDDPAQIQIAFPEMPGLNHVVLESLFERVTVYRRGSARCADVRDQAGYVVFGVFQFPYHQVVRLEVTHLIEIGAETRDSMVTVNDWAGPGGTDIECQTSLAAVQISDIPDLKIAFSHLSGLDQ